MRKIEIWKLKSFLFYCKEEEEEVEEVEEKNYKINKVIIGREIAYYAQRDRQRERDRKR